MNMPDMPMTGPGPGSEGPSRIFYVVAALVLALGVVGFAFFLVTSLMGMDEGFVRVVVPGTSEVHLDEVGEYTIFHEYQSVIDGKVYSGGASISGMKVSLINKDADEEITLLPMTISSTYNMGGRSAYGVFSATITTPGLYQISAYYPEGSDGPDTVLSLSQGFVEDLLVTIFSSIAILGGSIIAAILIFVVTLVKRAHAAKSAPRSQYGQMG